MFTMIMMFETFCVIKLRLSDGNDAGINCRAGSSFRIFNAIIARY